LAFPHNPQVNFISDPSFEAPIVSTAMIVQRNNEWEKLVELKARGTLTQENQTDFKYTSEITVH
jgi:hypothetical protein